MPFRVQDDLSQADKRVAFFATDVFLRLNGWKLEVDDVAAYEFLIGHLEDGRADFGNLEAWLRASTEPR